MVVRNPATVTAEFDLQVYTGKEIITYPYNIAPGSEVFIDFTPGIYEGWASIPAGQAYLGDIKIEEGKIIYLDLPEE